MSSNLRLFDLSIKDPVARIEAYIGWYQSNVAYTGFEAVLMRNIGVVSAEKVTQSQCDCIARAMFEITVTPAMCNPMDNMHGGAVATLADMATTMATAPLSEKGFWEFGGVSRSLTVTYLSPLPLGSTVLVECTLKSAGKRLSVTLCTIKDKASGTLFALAQHDKSALAPQEKVRRGENKL